LVEPPAFALEAEHMSVVIEPVEQRRHDDDIAEHGREPPNSNE
jgi:hypothetical protein